MNNLTKQEREVSVFEHYTSEQLELIKNQIAKNSSNQELLMFLNICKQRGLDPLSNQIWFIKYGNGKPVITASIDGLRAQAERTGEMSGMEGPLWCGSNGEWKDVWLDDTPPSAAKVTVYRKGCSHGFTGIALWKEYYNPKNPAWKNFPTHMLAKVAEAHALRKAYPQVLSGLYESSEIREWNDNSNSSIKDAKTTVEAEIIKEPEPESNTFDIAKHKEFLTGIIQQFGVAPEVLTPADKKEVVMSLKNVDLEFVPEIVRQFLIEKRLRDAETN